jgi:hypothetical protein
MHRALPIVVCGLFVAGEAFHPRTQMRAQEHIHPDVHVQEPVSNRTIIVDSSVGAMPSGTLDLLKSLGCAPGYIANERGRVAHISPRQT